MMFFLFVDVEVGVSSLSPILSFGWTGPVFAFLVADLQPPYNGVELSEFQVFSKFLGGSEDDASLAWRGSRKKLRTNGRRGDCYPIGQVRLGGWHEVGFVSAEPDVGVPHSVRRLRRHRLLSRG